MADFTKEQALINLKGLIRKYNENKFDKGFASNESQISESLIKPFVNLILGYDTSDPSEFKVQSSMGGKRSDMLVCSNGVTQFIIEAKALSHDIRKDYQYYQQAIYYAHTKEKKFAILTNFKHFIILDAEIEKEPLKAEVALIDIEKYEENFDILWAFSKEAWQQKGEDNEILLKLKGKKKQKIDEQLLDDLKRWRELLLNSLRKHSQKNKYDFDKDISKIEEEVQKFIDRLVFICYCEDKKLMDVELNPIINDKDRFWDKEWYALDRVRKLFEVYFQKYNSDLFNESWCDKFYFDDNTLIRVLKDLRQPQGKQPYDFSIIEADILGKAYENFIGHVLTGQKRFKEKESKGKRKSEGIYYTPTYIVDYIVRNTVSEYIKGKSIASINKVKILDPACGSGSFLIKAFDVLIEECERIRMLTYEEKKDLMLNCILGLDKDERAVEICKLNLSLKLAEIGQKLPELYNNIKCGDSLIDDENVAGDKAFNWNEEFKDIMQNGGFDVVIGNPPWVSIKGKHKSMEISQEELQYFFEKYNCDTYMPNLYEIFIWRCLSLFKKEGLFSFIVPDRLCANQQFINLRRDILTKFNLKKLWFKVHFPEIIADTVVFVIENNNPKKFVEIAEYPNTDFEKIEQKVYSNNSDNSFFYIKEGIYNIFKKILSSENIALLGNIIESTSGCGAKSTQIHAERKNSRQINILKGESIQRYKLVKKFWFEFNDKNLTGRTRDINKLSKKYKVLLRKTGLNLIADFDDTGIYPEQSLYFLYTNEDNNLESLKFLLTLLNSAVINCYYRNFAITNRESTPQLKNIDLDKFPIKIPKDKNNFIKLADKMLSLNKKLQEIGDKNTLEKQKIEQEIKKTDNEIDELVYQLYGITEEEKKIIEESLK